ncbi:hypothetical protein ACKKBG_A05830 [Auxenochlorella protothecoides x Auxenochlorella symbiontica]
MPAAPPADGCRREVTTAHQLLRKLYMLAGASVGIGAGVSAAIQREVPQSMKGVKRQACASLHRLRRRTRPSRRVLAEGADEKLRGAYRVAGAAMGISTGLRIAMLRLYLDLAEDEVTRSLIMGSPIRYKDPDLRRRKASIYTRHQAHPLRPLS